MLLKMLFLFALLFLISIWYTDTFLQELLSKYIFDKEGKLPVQILALLGGVFVATISSLYAPIYRDNRGRKMAIKIFLQSLEDAQRHCLVSLNTLFSIDFSKGNPLIVYFTKLTIPKDAPFFSEEIFQQIGDKNVKGIQNLRAKARNINIEIEAMIEYLKTSNLNKEQKTEYFHYLIQKIE